MHIRKLKGIAPHEVARLKGIQVKTVEALWERVSHDLDHGITELAHASGIGARRLCELLADEALADRGMWRRHWPDLLLFAAPIGLVILGLHTYAPLPWWPARVEQVVVGTTALQPFHVVRDTDITVKRAPAQAGTYATASEVLGRYPLESVPAGAPLRVNQLSTIKLAPSDLIGLDLLSVPVSRNRLTAATAPGARVTLLFSPREAAEGTSQPCVLSDLLVLAVQPGADTASLTVAAKRDDAVRVAPVLGVSEVSVLQPVR